MASIKKPHGANHNTIVEYEGLECDYDPDSKILKIEIPAQRDAEATKKLVELCRHFQLRDSQIDEVVCTFDDFQVTNFIQGHRRRGYR